MTPLDIILWALAVLVVVFVLLVLVGVVDATIKALRGKSREKLSPRKVHAPDRTTRVL